MKNLQIPIFKLQKNSNFQTPKLPCDAAGLWVSCLKFLWSLVVEAWNFLPRGLALFLGGFSLLNLVGERRAPGFDANLWWIDLRVLSHTLADVFLLLCAFCLIACGLRPANGGWRRWLTAGCLAALLVWSGANVAQFYALLVRGVIAPAIPVPLSLFIAGALALILAVNCRPFSTTHFSPFTIYKPIPALVVCVCCLVFFPLAQMFCFGKTDYRRPADVAVVPGARVYADGRLSDALADRVRTACQLYRQGLTKRLLFSGGPGDGAIHETEAMKAMALQLGVKPEDILLDKAGLNTLATVGNSEAIFAKLHASRILVVSHFYHLPRIKLAYQRRGLDVYTVPAKETYVLRQMPYNMAREVAALWVYYLRPLAGAHPAPRDSSSRG
jgi:vancomycin permeability regulator SanA